MSNEPSANAYDLVTCRPTDLGAAEFARCFALLEAGAAVDMDTAKRDLPLSPAIVLVRYALQIVALGCNKGPRAWYATKIADADHSGFEFPPDTPEIGYIVVDPDHRDNHLSTRIVAALLENHRGPLFATTDRPRMRAVLQGAGFLQKGSQWGQRAQLSLWIRTSTAAAALSE